MNQRLEDKRAGQLSKLPRDVLQHQLDDDHVLPEPSDRTMLHPVNVQIPTSG
jgi:hypothetical protein